MKTIIENSLKQIQECAIATGMRGTVVIGVEVTTPEQMQEFDKAIMELQDVWDGYGFNFPVTNDCEVKVITK